MSEIDIGVLDTVEPDEFATHLRKQGLRQARAANWNTAGDLTTAAAVIDELLGTIYELQETIDGFSNPRG